VPSIPHAIDPQSCQIGAAMTIKQFIRRNKREIDAIILEYYGQKPENDESRYEWILNDRGLYEWAHQEGVNI
jgi:hypothetical protein